MIKISSMKPDNIPDAVKHSLPIIAIAHPFRILRMAETK